MNIDNPDKPAVVAYVNITASWKCGWYTYMAQRDTWPEKRQPSQSSTLLQS